LSDKLIFVWLYRFFPAVSDTAVIFKPEALRHGHTERLIDSIRRECLDHVVIFGEARLAGP